MKYLFSIAAAGMLVVAFNSTASAQSFYPGGSYYGSPYAYPYSAYPQGVGATFRYSTPSIGFGININPTYGSSFGIYSQPSYYYPAWNGDRYYRNQYGHHHHHHGHGHGHGHGHR
jgi:hypothetical protein